MRLYKSQCGKSREILPSLGAENPGIAQKGRLQPRRHDLLWLLGPPLATDRGRTSDYGDNPSANLRDVPGLDGEAGSRIRREEITFQKGY